MNTLIIGTLSIPTVAALDIDQAYEPLGGESIFRTVSGAGLKQSTWQRTRIVTSGRGWLPAGLDTLDSTQQHVLKCITPRRVPADFATRQATLPAARRSDTGHTPWGVALMSDGSPVYTPAAMGGDVATLDAVAGAVAYQALYFPQMTVWVARPTDSGTRSDASYQWQLVCEEV
ncbi:MAG: hypothetical protein KBH41_15180 [Azonexus sp.]|nr:hypothetical protein [Azonexus sp.]